MFKCDFVQYVQIEHRFTYEEITILAECSFTIVLVTCNYKANVIRPLAI